MLFTDAAFDGAARCVVTRTGRMFQLSATARLIAGRRPNGERRSQRGGSGCRLEDRSSTTLTIIDVVNEGAQHEPWSIPSR